MSFERSSMFPLRYTAHIDHNGAPNTLALGLDGLGTIRRNSLFRESSHLDGENAEKASSLSGAPPLLTPDRLAN